jgi:hypothetical protein
MVILGVVDMEDMKEWFSLLCLAAYKFVFGNAYARIFLRIASYIAVFGFGYEVASW